MKKILYVLLCVVMLVAPVTTARCENDIKVTLDGKELVFDVPPRIIDERTMVPMRAIFEAMGATVKWDDITKAVHAVRIDEYGMSEYVIMQIGSNVLVKGVTDTQTARDVSEEKITLDVPPQIVDDRTLVPIRAVSEAFDCSVEWDGETRTVTIASAKPAEPEETAAPPAESAEPEETAAPPAETNEPAVYDIPIEYDNTNELRAHYMRDFQILACETNAEGDYVITYQLRTFLEGKGAVSVSFNCLSESGAVIDSFGGMYVGTDYTWSWHTSTATVSGKTVKIELALTD